VFEALPLGEMRDLRHLTASRVCIRELRCSARSRRSPTMTAAYQTARRATRIAQRRPCARTRSRLVNARGTPSPCFEPPARLHRDLLTRRALSSHANLDALIRVAHWEDSTHNAQVDQVLLCGSRSNQ
jgi:hypothetical protein